MKEPFAINLGWDKVLEDRGYILSRIAPHGPSGISCKFRNEKSMLRRKQLGSIIVSQAAYDGVEWLHASIAYDDQDWMPEYEDLASLHRAVFGRKRYAYQLFVPESSHVNIRSNALHLWGRADGEPAMLDFGKIEGTI